MGASDEDIKIWIKARDKKDSYVKKLLGQDYDLFKEIYLRQELFEGTARYVEEKFQEILGAKPKEDDDFYISGGENYYRSGALKSSILDKRLGSWKELSFDGSVSLDYLLESTL